MKTFNMSGFIGVAIVAVALIGNAGAGAKGVRQSPIDIQPRSAMAAKAPSPIAAHFASSATLDVYNTYDPAGTLHHEWATLKANVPAGSSVVVDGVSFQLLQFHFHTPAEHAVDGKRSAMEVHFVFLRDGAPPCGRGPDALLVIGARIEAGAANAELGKIFDRADLPADKAAPHLTVEHFNLGNVLGPLDHSWRYSGSLTAPASFEPTCKQAEGSVAEQLAADDLPENVSWVVLPHAITMSPAQIEAFRKLFHEGNTRALQPLEGRGVTAY